jgi:hypothetical protein
VGGGGGTLPSPLVVSGSPACGAGGLAVDSLPGRLLTLGHSSGSESKGDGSLDSSVRVQRWGVCGCPLLLKNEGVCVWVVSTTGDGSPSSACGSSCSGMENT